MPSGPGRGFLQRQHKTVSWYGDEGSRVVYVSRDPLICAQFKRSTSSILQINEKGRQKNKKQKLRHIGNDTLDHRKSILNIFSIESTPKNQLGKPTSEITFHHSKVFVWPLATYKNGFFSNPPNGQNGILSLLIPTYRLVYQTW